MAVARRRPLRRHHHGQPVRLADPAPCRRDAGRLGVPHETRIVSAHRTPDRLREYAATARERGLRVIIAGAGGAAHLPGMCAAWTPLPVLGVPVESHALKGMDSACCRSCRCRPACRSAPWRSAGPARSTPACWPPPSWPWRDPALAARLDALRAPRRPRRCAATRGRTIPAMTVPAAAECHDRPGRRRPARPHVGDGGGAARLSLPRPDAARWTARPPRSPPA